MGQAEVIVIGAGVMGMLTARELAQAGMQVRVLERQQPAHEASWAGGGIVSPLYPWRYDDAITALASWSQRSYLQLRDALLQETGIDPELRQKGMLMLAVDDQDEALAWAERCQRPLQLVGGEVVHELEPLLPQSADQALWMPEVASIRNPRLGQALRRSLELHPNIELVADAEVTAIDQVQGCVKAVHTASGQHRAERYVLCTGAWTGGLAQQLGLQIHVQPVKGQMLLFKAEPGVLNRVVLQGSRYIIPRNDGRILVGSTLEFEGFDKSTTEAAQESLQASALSIMPALAEYPVEAHWAGLRPGSPSGIPYIGQAPGLDNCWINAGHFRNGLVLAPASCRLLADLLLQRQPVIDPAPYACEAQRPERIL